MAAPSLPPRSYCLNVAPRLYRDGLALLTGFFVLLAPLVLAPNRVNTAFFHVALDPSGLRVAVVLSALSVGIAMTHRADPLPLLRAKRGAV
jgi:hypothetical protein